MYEIAPKKTTNRATHTAMRVNATLDFARVLYITCSMMINVVVSKE